MFNNNCTLQYNDQKIFIDDALIDVSYKDYVVPFSNNVNNIVICFKTSKDVLEKIYDMSNFFYKNGIIKNILILAIAYEGNLITCFSPVIESIFSNKKKISINIISECIEYKESKALMRKIKIEKIINRMNDK